jgi:hypothetical protein
MRTVRATVGALLVGSLLGIASPAAAAPATTYRGVFTGVTYGSGAGVTPASGTWNVAWRDGKVTATFNLFVDGAHHVAYGLPPTVITPSPSGTSFSFLSGASANPLTVTISGDVMTYVIAPYDYQGTHYDVVTYTGTVDR